MEKESHTVAEQSDNRARILDHALRLFVAQGYDAVGVQAICDAAGITKPTLYHYFGNKRGLLEAIMDTWGAPFLRELATVAAYDGDLQYRLLLVVQTFFGFAQQHPQVYRLLLASWFAATQNEVYDVSAAIHTEQQQVLEGLFTSATPDHGNMRIAPAHIRGDVTWHDQHLCGVMAQRSRPPRHAGGAGSGSAVFVRHLFLIFLQMVYLPVCIWSSQ